MRKGSTEMWWIIIGAVIALVVLIILMVLFTGKTRGLEGGLTECEGKGGICTKEVSQECPGKTLLSTSFNCKDSAQKCCIGIPTECTGPAACGGETGSCPESAYDNGKRYCK